MFIIINKDQLDMKFRKILIIIIDKFSFDSDCWKKIFELTQEVVLLPKEDSRIQKELLDSDCLLTGFGITVGREEIDSAPDLKYIGSRAKAYGKIDIDYAKEKGIIVTNIPEYATEAVAEFTFAAILEALRELESGKIKCRKGMYSEEGFNVKEIKNKRFGIIGLGNIGKRVSEIALAFGADVSYWSRTRKKEYESKGIKYRNIDLVISESDILSLHIAQTKETNNFLNKKRINNLKKGSLLVNTSPMELIDINSLSKRLAKKDLIFIYDHSDELNKSDLEKLSMENCITYPPIACITDEAKIKRQEVFIGNLENFLKGIPTSVVN